MKYTDVPICQRPDMIGADLSTRLAAVFGSLGQGSTAVAPAELWNIKPVVTPFQGGKDVEEYEYSSDEEDTDEEANEHAVSLSGSESENENNDGDLYEDGSESIAAVSDGRARGKGTRGVTSGDNLWSSSSQARRAFDREEEEDEADRIATGLATGGRSLPEDSRPSLRTEVVDDNVFDRICLLRSGHAQMPDPDSGFPGAAAVGGLGAGADGDAPMLCDTTDSPADSSAVCGYDSVTMTATTIAAQQRQRVIDGGPSSSSVPWETDAAAAAAVQETPLDDALSFNASFFALAAEVRAPLLLPLGIGAPEQAAARDLSAAAPSMLSCSAAARGGGGSEGEGASLSRRIFERVTGDAADGQASPGSRTHQMVSMEYSAALEDLEDLDDDDDLPDLERPMEDEQELVPSSTITAAASKRNRGGERIVWASPAVASMEHIRISPKPVSSILHSGIRKASGSTAGFSGSGGPRTKRVSFSSAAGHASLDDDDDEDENFSPVPSTSLDQGHTRAFPSLSAGSNPSRRRQPRVDLQWLKKGFVPDHVRNPQRYTLYELDETLSVGGQLRRQGGPGDATPSRAAANSGSAVSDALSRDVAMTDAAKDDVFVVGGGATKAPSGDDHPSSAEETGGISNARPKPSLHPSPSDACNDTSNPELAVGSGAVAFRARSKRQTNGAEANAANEAAKNKANDNESEGEVAAGASASSSSPSMGDSAASSSRPHAPRPGVLCCREDEEAAAEEEGDAARRSAPAAAGTRRRPRHFRTKKPLDADGA